MHGWNIRGIHINAKARRRERPDGGMVSSYGQDKVNCEGWILESMTRNLEIILATWHDPTFSFCHLKLYALKVAFNSACGLS